MFYSNQTVKEKSISFRHDLHARYYDYQHSSDRTAVSSRANTLLGSLTDESILQDFDAFIHKGIPILEIASLLESSNVIDYKSKVNYAFTKFWINNPSAQEPYNKFMVSKIWNGLLSYDHFENGQQSPLLLLSMTDAHYRILEKYSLPNSMYTKLIFLLNRDTSGFEEKLNNQLNFVFKRLSNQSTDWWRKSALTHIDVLYNILSKRPIINNSNSVPHKYSHQILNLNKDAYEAVVVAKNLDFSWQECAALFEANTLKADTLKPLEMDASILESLDYPT